MGNNFATAKSEQANTLDTCTILGHLDRLKTMAQSIQTIWLSSALPAIKGNSGRGDDDEGSAHAEPTDLGSCDNVAISAGPYNPCNHSLFTIQVLPALFLCALELNWQLRCFDILLSWWQPAQTMHDLRDIVCDLSNSIIAILPSTLSKSTI